LGALAFFVKRKSNQFFAGTTLTLNRDMGITSGNLFDRFEQLSHYDTFANNPSVPASHFYR